MVFVWYDYCFASKDLTGMFQCLLIFVALVSVVYIIIGLVTINLITLASMSVSVKCSNQFSLISLRNVVQCSCTVVLFG